MPRPTPSCSPPPRRPAGSAPRPPALRARTGPAPGCRTAAGGSRSSRCGATGQGRPPPRPLSGPSSGTTAAEPWCSVRGVAQVVERHAADGLGGEVLLHPRSDLLGGVAAAVLTAHADPAADEPVDPAVGDVLLELGH